jgi:type I restriction enzyme S subunit
MKMEWKKLPFLDIISDESGGNVKIPQSGYLPEGKFAIVDQGKKLISGFTNEETCLCHAELPVIVFGDHTCCFKYIDFPFCLGADGVKVLRPKIVADIKYLYYFLSSLRLTERGYDRHYKYLNRFDIIMPPLNEQRRIAEILDKAEALRAKRRAALAQLDTLTQSIFLEMFGDPVVNQKNWKMQKLTNLGTLDRGVSKHRPRNAPELLGGLHPLVQTGDIANCDGYIRSYSNTYSDLGLKQSKKWPKGTLCITIAANIAKTGILTFDACFPDSVVGFRSEDPATVEFVRIWLSFLQKNLEDNAPESAQKNINLAILRNLDVPFPPIELQREFLNRVAALEELKNSHRASLARLDELFASLQYRAFRREL